jgi:hypothetical protein
MKTPIIYTSTGVAFCSYAHEDPKLRRPKICPSNDHDTLEAAETCFWNQISDKDTHGCDERSGIEW